MFNIITPTYNRSHTLDRVFQSLLNQTEKRFKWIVVDDGSTDDTQDLISSWKLMHPQVDIEYYKLTENQGKPNAVNYGLNKSTLEYTIIADSDDSFENSTLSDLKLIWESVNLTKDKDKIASIWTLTKDENNNLIGHLYPKNYWQVGFKERVIDNNIEGEKWHCWRTHILKKNPLFEGNQCHVFESTTWNKINKKYDFLCVNIAHRHYFNSEDGIIATKVSKKRLARTYFYSSFHELNITHISEIIKHQHYRSLAFEYIKARMYYSDNNYKLSGEKYILALIIFILSIPHRILVKLQ